MTDEKTKSEIIIGGAVTEEHKKKIAELLPKGEEERKGIKEDCLEKVYEHIDVLTDILDKYIHTNKEKRFRYLSNNLTEIFTKFVTGMDTSIKAHKTFVEILEKQEFINSYIAMFLANYIDNEFGETVDEQVNLFSETTFMKIVSDISTDVNTLMNNRPEALSDLCASIRQKDPHLTDTEMHEFVMVLYSYMGYVCSLMKLCELQGEMKSLEAEQLIQMKDYIKSYAEKMPDIVITPEGEEWHELGNMVSYTYLYQGIAEKVISQLVSIIIRKAEELVGFNVSAVNSETRLTIDDFRPKKRPTRH